MELREGNGVLVCLKCIIIMYENVIVKFIIWYNEYMLMKRIKESRGGSKWGKKEKAWDLKVKEKFSFFWF